MQEQPHHMILRRFSFLIEFLFLDVDFWPVTLGICCSPRLLNWLTSGLRRNFHMRWAYNLVDFKGL
jgi:hypothetical protein